MNRAWGFRDGLYGEKYFGALDLVNTFKNLRFEWVPREENTVADALSRKAYEEHCMA